MQPTAAHRRIPSRSGLLVAPMPGATVEVHAIALGLPGEMLVAVCEESASRLALCSRTGRASAVLKADDELTVTRAGRRHVVAAAWTSLGRACGPLDLLCEPIARRPIQQL